MKAFIKSIPILIIIFFLVSNLNFLKLPLDQDEGVFAYIGYNWAHGNIVPYRDAFDHKPPVVFIIYGLSAIFEPSSLSIRLISLVYKSIILVALYLFLKRISNIKIALSLTFICVFYFTSPSLQSIHFLTEILISLPSLLFIYFVYKLLHDEKNQKNLAIFAGLSASAAFLIRSPIILLILFIFVFLLFKMKRYSIYFLIGFVIPLLLFLIYFILNGSFQVFLGDVAYYNIFYVNDGFENSVFQNIPTFALWFFHGPVIIYPLIILAIFSLILTFKRRDTLWFLTFIWLLTSCISIKMGGFREFNHYFILLILPALASIAVFLKHLKKKYLIYMLVIIILILCATAVFCDYKYYKNDKLAILNYEFGERGSEFYNSEIVAKWILERKIPSDKVLVWANEPEIYYYTSSIAPKYNYFYGLSYETDQYNKWLSSFDVNKINWLITYSKPLDLSPTPKYFLTEHPEFVRVNTIGNFVIYKKQNSR